MNLARPIPTVASLAIKGVQQARVFRAMLSLGTFTRKELAAQSGVDLETVNAVVLRHKDWFRDGQPIRTGRQGPPEKPLILLPEMQQELRQLLQPLYEDLASERAGKTQAANEYVPKAIEFQVVSDLVSTATKEGQLSAAQFRRALRLLEGVSQKEDLPVSDSLEGYLKNDDSRTASATQKMAKAHMDALRAKLCLLSVPQFLSGEPVEAFGFRDPIKFGCAFLESADLTFLELDAGKHVRELDEWAEQHISPVIARFLASPDSSREHWAKAIQESFNSPQIAKLAPHFSGKFAPLWFEIMEPPRPERVGTRIPCTLIEVARAGLGFQVRSVTRRFITRPSREAIPVMADTPRIFDGMASIYCSNYQPPEDKVAALINIRRAEVHVAILQGAALVFSRTFSLPDRVHHAIHDPASPVPAKRMFGNDPTPSGGEDQVMMDELQRTFEFCKASVGQPVGSIYVMGEPILGRNLESALRATFDVPAQQLDPLEHLREITAGYSDEEQAERTRQLAPEIGIALKECQVRLLTTEPFKVGS